MHLKPPANFPSVWGFDRGLRDELRVLQLREGADAAYLAAYACMLAGAGFIEREHGTAHILNVLKGEQLRRLSRLLCGSNLD
jgi:hypothetical protein